MFWKQPGTAPLEPSFNQLFTGTRKNSAFMTFAFPPWKPPQKKASFKKLNLNQCLRKSAKACPFLDMPALVAAGRTQSRLSFKALFFRDKADSVAARAADRADQRNHRPILNRDPTLDKHDPVLDRLVLESLGDTFLNQLG